ncbi:tRNA lysidine(34) synthetase TilS [Flavobacterium amnicola]|uniref:tRNA(Ile)-lysidine synthase n=1 Tax=Flavobacterium amnicola TaxID=2506422 RepID=A0A4Q1K0U9_9FLAO|nr:tRNA lysidine(34) synthetase TilS [Flavobacterium amnicola]RXR17336.1 tRNA lysidine(34) synthetase TilS [Flavobacterium amnicola]
MLSKLKTHLANNLSFLQGKKLLLAVSGGLDSMVLTHLFQKLDTTFGIAHCNFQLREAESFGDQEFVQTYADANKIPFYLTLFDTQSYANDYKLSTQVAARELRYHWFYELLATEGYDFVLTAHHADDNLETFLINLSRGTGLEGLTGIPKQNEQIIRPLLIFSREDIESYAKENNIQWREDSSNASDKYLRNKIRHHLVPLFKELNPNFLASFQKTQTYLQEAQLLVEDATDMVFQQIATEKEDGIYFDLHKLLQLDNYNSYLFQWLKEFGFTAWEDIYDLVTAQSGKYVVSEEFRLLKDRDFLILSSLEEFDHQEFWIQENENQLDFPIKLRLSDESHIKNPADKCIFVDKEKLKFPLKIRKWQEGDYFYPSGMHGKKKVSKFFKDEKFSLIDKENTWLLCSDDQIVWIVNHRADQRYLATEFTQHILKIEVHK